jgi:hypothetical protein
MPINASLDFTIMSLECKFTKFAESTTDSGYHEKKSIFLFLMGNGFMFRRKILFHNYEIDGSIVFSRWSNIRDWNDNDHAN